LRASLLEARQEPVTPATVEELQNHTTPPHRRLLWPHLESIEHWVHL